MQSIQGKCSFDSSQSGKLKSMAVALSQQAHACLEWTPMEKLITFNSTRLTLWTFHTNSLLHRYLFLMRVQE